MSKKFKVSICSGTTCYVLGGAQMMILEDCLPADIKDEVEVVGSSCLQKCHEPNAKPPFVLINDYLMESASMTKVIDYIREHR
ncbi:MAG: (2Fe-2S) ferredoxin domain-containing protein [Candidatus Riflebacteria bacterium]|nr:(2Fe-2S) ferredoxin domain-containing protein [Candidatus Riflebacteria bacterium]MDD2623237.1 (2Fe-2S) ferredoxin domain-containing protein [Candidatus Riflebacteria bacterium]MDD3376014.1 (2Fe-2S) ferredoxin domain-containing protein [Candidatus Riflebacteria bacterium]NLV95384.1 (2Fe-2S) ferredoxin domain-containing protein [Candidatus Riflebacteria bacterium]